MLRAIREISPRWVVGENVSGLLSWNGGMVFNEVQADLEAEGYEVLPFLLPACAVNAPHRRDRIWFIAYANGARKRNNIRANDGKESEVWRGEAGNVFGELRGNESTPNPASDRRERNGQGFEVENGEQGSEQLRELEGGFEGLCGSGVVADTNKIGLPNEKQIRKLERLGFSESDIGNSWEKFPTQSPICSRNDGVPGGLAGITVSKHRNESIKAYGNAIVPAVALQIFKAIQQYETNQAAISPD
jgi:DNA (cytosine-5)-methyltransferase 1